MKFIKIVWSLHCLGPLDPVCSLQKTSNTILPGPGSEASQSDDESVPQPLVLAAVQPPDDPPEPAVLGGGEDQHPGVRGRRTVACREECNDSAECGELLRQSEQQN